MRGGTLRAAADVLEAALGPGSSEHFGVAAWPAETRGRVSWRSQHPQLSPTSWLGGGGDAGDTGSAAGSGKTVEFTTRSGKTVVLNNESKSECIESCKNAPELKDANNAGGIDGLLGAVSGGERQSVADCINFCGVEHEMWCFPGDSTVVVRGRGRVPLSELCLGDMVLMASPSSHRPPADTEQSSAVLGPPDEAAAKAGCGRELQFSAVLAWLHRDPEAEAEVLEIQHELGKLRLTANHLVFAQRRSVQHDDRSCSRSYFGSSPSSSSTAAVPTIAREVEVGDRVLAPWFDGTLALPQVKSVAQLRKRGLYAPLLDGGNLVVDGTVASCYAIPRHIAASPLFKHLGKYCDDGAAFHAAAHVLFLPLRMLCQPTPSNRLPTPRKRLALHYKEKLWEEAKDDLEPHIDLPQNFQGVHPYAWVCYIGLASLVA